MTYDLSEVANAAKEMKRQAPINATVHSKILECKGLDKLAVHATANLFPLMKDTDKESYEEFLADVKKQGEVLEPIRIDSTGNIIDGRNRVQAIQDLKGKVKFKVEVLQVPDVQGWILSTNLHRRHLTTSQRAMIAAQLSNATKSDGGKRSTKAPEAKAQAQAQAVTQTQAAKALNVSHKSVKRANQVVKSGDKKLMNDVKSGKTSLNQAVTQVQAKKPKAQKTQNTQGQKAQVSNTTPKPAAKPNKTSGLSAEEVQQVKELCARATNVQLEGFRSYVSGLLKVAAK